MSSPQDLEIRKAIHADLPSIVRMLADDKLGQTRESDADPIPRSYENAFEEILQSDANELLVAIAEKEVVGVFQLTFIPYLTFRGGRRAQIEGVRVDTKHRSQGIGRHMIEEAISRATEKGCHLIQLTTSKSRPEARKFYESLGFESTHEGFKQSLDTKTGVPKA